MTKVMLLKTWLSNIGNGFIDKGSHACINEALNDPQIVEVSGYPNFVGHYLNLSWKNKLLERKNKFELEQLNSINVADFVDDVDIAIISGCILDWSIVKYVPTIKKIRDRGIPLVLLGAGGSDYTIDTQNLIKKVINILKPSALFTRDSNAYALYSKYFNRSYNGIDSGFYISDWYLPPKSTKQFIVAAFDSSKEPRISTNFTILRAYHEPFYYSYAYNKVLRICIDLAKEIFNLNLCDISHKKNILISDCIEDYLFLYYNATEVYSDRVHACVAALSYGNKARLYSNTPRSALFDRVLNTDINKELSSLPREKIYEEKTNQASILKEVIQDII